MNGNNPYAGAPEVVDAGRPAAEALTADELRTLREAMAGIVDRTRNHLPNDYAIGSEVSHGARGIEATVAVRPPVGDPVSAGLSPDRADLTDGIGSAERDEVARGLAASAALQVMDAVGDDLPSTAG
jgi:hypothetical protein